MSYQVIARKYRPQTFDEVVGQRLVCETLKNAILSNRVAHGYIFSGARGVGKTTMARLLAKALNCVQGPTVQPCGECASCLEITAGNSVDVLEIDAASNRGIDEIRRLRENVRYLPARDRYKIFIIDEVHMLTTEAFNALLKTLEEPPDRALFILATTEAHKLPATIQSRCQHFAFRLLDYSEIVARLEEICRREGVAASGGALGAIAQAAEGSLRDALSLLDEVIAACGAQVDEEKVRQLLGVVPSRLLREMAEAIHAGDSRRALELVSEVAKEGYDLSAFCGEFTRLVRNLMVARSCGAESTLLQVPEDERDVIRKLAGLFTEEDLTRFFQILLRAQAEMRYSLQPRFHLELALMKLVHAPKLAAFEGLLSAARDSRTPAGGSSGAPSGTSGPSIGAARSSSAAVSQPRDVKAAQSTMATTAATAGGSGLDRAPIARSGPPQPVASRQPVQPVPATSPTQNADPTPKPSGATALSPLAAPSDEQAASAQDARLSAIKALLFEQSKFLSSCLNPVAGWRFENGQVHFLYSRDGSWAADLLKSREHQEKLRIACEKVLGQPVKIYVTLNSEANQPVPARPSAQERARRDPAVEAFQKRFDCVVMDVKDLSRG
ncbi:MAG: DNA polymerase III subunit gamma/tau [Terriglobia bacterium]